MSLFNRSVKLIHKIDNRNKKGIKVLEYRWIPFFNPVEVDSDLKEAIAFLEFDLSYISVPHFVFDQIRSYFESELA
jgi:hypothetical protein